MTIKIYNNVHVQVHGSAVDLYGVDRKTLLHGTGAPDQNISSKLNFDGCDEIDSLLTRLKNDHDHSWDLKRFNGSDTGSGFILLEVTNKEEYELVLQKLELK